MQSVSAEMDCTAPPRRLAAKVAVRWSVYCSSSDLSSGGTRWSGRGCARCTGGAAAEPHGAAETGAAFWPVVRFVTDLYVNQPVSRVHPIILHKVISRRRRGRDNWIEL